MLPIRCDDKTSNIISKDSDYFGRKLIHIKVFALRSTSTRLGNFINRAAALKRKSYEGLSNSVLVMEAEKNHLKSVNFLFSTFMVCKIMKKVNVMLLFGLRTSYLN